MGEFNKSCLMYEKVSDEYREENRELPIPNKSNKSIIFTKEEQKLIIERECKKYLNKGKKNDLLSYIRQND